MVFKGIVSWEEQSIQVEERLVIFHEDLTPVRIFVLYLKELLNIDIIID